MNFDDDGNSRFTPKGQGAVRVLTGKDIARLDRACQTATDRACLAVALTNAIVDRVTPQQAIMLARAGATYTSVLQTMTPLEVSAVKDGRIKLADVVQHKRRQALSNDEIDELVVDVGLGRIWAALERATQPFAVAAE